MTPEASRSFSPFTPWTRLVVSDDELESVVRSSFSRAQWLVQVFYVFLSYYAFVSFPKVASIAGHVGPDLIWSVRWIDASFWHPAVIVIGVGMVAGSIMAAAFPHWLVARLVAFAALFLFESLTNSFGKINHSGHVLVLLSFVFVLLPSVPDAGSPGFARLRQRYMEVVWGAQAVTLLTYTLAGLSKIRWAWLDIAMGQPSLFSIDSMALRIAGDFQALGKTSLLGLGEWIIQYPIAGFPFLIGATLFELFSFPVAWKPRLHRVWGMGLIGFHLGVGLIMEVYFFNLIFLMGLMFLASPFAPEGQKFTFRIRDLPWLGPFLSALLVEMRVQRQKSSTVDGQTDSPVVVLFFDEENRGHQFWIRRFMAGEGSPSFKCIPKSDAAFEARAEQFSALRSTRGMIAFEATKRGTKLRLGSEAALWTSAWLRASAWRYAFALLIVPVPVLDAIAILARRFQRA